MKSVPEYRVRVPTGEDLPSLSRFSRKVLPDFPNDVFGKRWWWNHDPPTALIAEHVKTGEIAGLCGGKENRVWFSGEERVCISICDWYVAPDHLGKRLGNRMMNTHKSGNSVLNSLSLPDDATASLTRSQWRPMIRAPLYLAPLPRLTGFLRDWGNTRLQIVSQEVRHGDTFDEQSINTIWAHCDKSRSMMVRDSQTLRQHLSLTPEHTYTIEICKDGARPVGYMLAGLMPPRGVRQLGRSQVAAIVDFLVEPNTP